MESAQEWAVEAHKRSFFRGNNHSRISCRDRASPASRPENYVVCVSEIHMGCAVCGDGNGDIPEDAVSKQEIYEVVEEVV